MKKIILMGGLGLALFLNSCYSAKDMTYLQDMEAFKSYPMEEQNEVKIQQYDRLAITVAAKNPALATPFNLSNGTGGVFSIDNMSKASSDNKETKGYVVNQNGNIEFPVLGSLYVEGLTCSQVRDKIKKMLVDKGYIKEPIVVVDLLSFQISMLGEVNHEGIHTVQKKSLNLLEAIAMAGGLTDNARLDRVMVIRTENGKRTAYAHNLRLQEIYSSPVFQLQQNDVVYVEPNRYKPNGKRERIKSDFSLLLSIAAIVTTAIYLLR